MASNQVVPKDGPLSMMKQLSPSCFLYEPSSTTPVDTKAPKLIALFSWMAAQDAHIAKYLAQHLALYPTSKILLVRYALADTVFTASSKRDIQPAVSVVKSVADVSPKSSAEPQILFHVFSNGGGTNLTWFYDLYAAQSPNKTLVLPPHVTIFDSCPGNFHWGRMHLALSTGLPKVLSPTVHVLIVLLWLLGGPLGPFRRIPTFTVMMNSMNQAALLDSQLRRTYVYSDEDDVVLGKDVEGHAAQAKQLGFKVREEKFVGSKHVAHARHDMNRYWNMVKETWEGS